MCDLCRQQEQQALLQPRGFWLSLACWTVLSAQKPKKKKAVLVLAAAAQDTQTPGAADGASGSVDAAPSGWGPGKAKSSERSVSCSRVAAEIQTGKLRFRLGSFEVCWLGCGGSKV